MVCSFQGPVPGSKNVKGQSEQNLWMLRQVAEKAAEELVDKGACDENPAEKLKNAQVVDESGLHSKIGGTE